MTQKQIDTAKGYLASGYDLNQVAAIMMVGRHIIEEALATPTPAPAKKAKKETPKLDIDPMFVEEEGL